MAVFPEQYGFGAGAGGAPVPPSDLPQADARSTVEAKLALFERLFAGRADVRALLGAKSPAHALSWVFVRLS